MDQGNHVAVIDAAAVGSLKKPSRPSRLGGSKAFVLVCHVMELLMKRRGKAQWKK
jgi:hypothetical protein